MNRIRAFACGLVGSALATGAALSISVLPTDAYADDITMEPQPAVGVGQAGRAFPLKSTDLKYGPDEWTLQANQVSAQNTGYTRAQSQAEFKASRDLVRALYAEDSGSSQFKRPGEPGGTNVMGAPAR